MSNHGEEAGKKDLMRQMLGQAGLRPSKAIPCQGENGTSSIPGPGKMSGTHPSQGGGATP